MFSNLPFYLSLFTSALLFNPHPHATAYKPLSDTFLRAIPSPGHALNPQNGTLLAPLLIPRVPGTPGQTTAQRHFLDFFTRELPKWSVAWQNSTAATPVSNGADVPFANLVFKREPPWVKPGQANLLTLVAHYDSKVAPEGFVGATDSAAPCAMLLYVARVVDAYVSRMHEEMQELGEGGTVEMDMGIQILFLDGEEAFVQWSDEDSLYGSRALAKEWSESYNPPSATFYKYRTPLSQISLFVLLDLLGSASPSVPSYFPTTHWAYKKLSSIESRMRALDLLESSPSSPFLPDNNMTMARGAISDDHLPFIARGVEVLHVIPDPFPHVWHKMEDDGAHLDMETVRDWGKIMAAFALEWLDMSEVWDEPGEAGQ
ncbi:hypothetical protein P153DRAFT_282584 [Dothidotthia symphoricarpi CBS 119687]|uniref:Peptide hydrolase n=1 Tax=Dothidotthia symphoricarpi CBS 119687 TaxID=1392245 RepID=A0A6A6ARJ4_9PLEO|nr:uncharacterized protein P153DRAFT_282584 [Dothidotthia symphoricarpi CBS 119687]KAF2133467.1 hypothetical protein P153DRAFT_282584 [Dothidotthia symphoricarpi CBS 119687]